MLRLRKNSWDVSYSIGCSANSCFFSSYLFCANSMKEDIREKQMKCLVEQEVQETRKSWHAQATMCLTHKAPLIPKERHHHGL